MSIRHAAIATFAALALMGQAAPEPVPEAEPPQVTAEQALAAAQDSYGPPPPEPEVSPDCADPGPGEIVVCAALEEQSQFRVPSSLDEGDDSHLGWDGRPPDVAGPGIFTGPPTVSGLCLIPPCPKPPVYYFDITALPEAPEGSDADRIARGEMPE